MAEWIWELLDGPDTITEGPAWDGQALYYTAIDHDEIRRFDPVTGEISVVYGDTGATNGLIFGSDGTLYGCAGGARQMLRFNADGSRDVLADSFEGKRLNSPNDLVLDSQGRIWFTDPRYGDESDRELDHDSVYRITPPVSGEGAWQIERMTFDTTKPNGILLGWDEQTLYVAQSDHNPAAPRQLRAYPILADGTLGECRVLHDFGAWRGIDGMRWDSEGNIVATCGTERGGPGPSITVFATDGTVLEEHRLPADDPTNCHFGGENRDILFVTTMNGRLYRIANPGRRGRA